MAGSVYKPAVRMKRVIMGSFATGLLLGALYLLLQAVFSLRVRCDDPGQSECVFLEQTAHELGRQQALGAAGCALVGGGALLWLRSSKSPKRAA